MSPTCEPEAALERLGGDAALYAEAIAAFLADEAGLLGRLQIAIATADAAAVHAVAHALKGQAGLCGAAAVAETAAQLEAQGLRRELIETPRTFARLQADLQQAAIELKPYCR
jgi:HPt (histidine-containing phosphotransfer) domain-containing protein